MNIVIWIIQGVLAAMFLMAGIMKTTMPMEKLREKFPWSAAIPDGLIRFIGLSQLLISLGLVLPWLTGIVPVLTPIAAAGLALNMLLAAAFHLKRNERKDIPKNLIIMTMALIVAISRL